MRQSTSKHSDFKGESKYRIKRRKESALLAVIPVRELFCELSAIQDTKKVQVPCEPFQLCTFPCFAILCNVFKPNCIFSMVVDKFAMTYFAA